MGKCREVVNIGMYCMSFKVRVQVLLKIANLANKYGIAKISTYFDLIQNMC